MLTSTTTHLEGGQSLSTITSEDKCWMFNNSDGKTFIVSLMSTHLNDRKIMEKAAFVYPYKTDLYEFQGIVVVNIGSLPLYALEHESKLLFKREWFCCFERKLKDKVIYDIVLCRKREAEEGKEEGKEEGEELVVHSSLMLSPYLLIREFLITEVEEEEPFIAYFYGTMYKLSRDLSNVDLLLHQNGVLGLITERT